MVVVGYRLDGLEALFPVDQLAISFFIYWYLVQYMDWFNLAALFTVFQSQNMTNSVSVFRDELSCRICCLLQLMAAPRLTQNLKQAPEWKSTKHLIMR